MPTPYRDRTNTVADKLQLLEAAHRAGRLDVARSLAASITDTLEWEQQFSAPAPKPALAADRSVPVANLPKPWAQWARGWKHCMPLSLFETVGIARAGEPVDIAIAFPADQVTDPAREVRVARADAQSGALAEVPCQLDDDARRATERHGRLIFLADVPAHGQATYLVFYGNPLAERPAHQTDLQVQGEGYGLDIENDFYRARLSRQVGQLERLTYKRQHGLELYAGGKGHGEPPGIDWAHDYVDAEHFQKLRMRNWPQCPNAEVVRGPLCVRVRRYGFPYSPVHPLFTPSRVHMDQTYTFYAGLPYFYKHGRFDVLADVTIAAMRDDEWVLSGYSFTDMLWFDEQGKLHEGAVPAEQSNNLWGVGFYHRTSRDAFVALFLEHAAEGCQILHGGVPTLHYDGHGQLWSRYPAEAGTLHAGTTLSQKNAYVVSPFEGADATQKLEQLRHQLKHPLEVQPADVPRSATAAAAGDPLARPGETAETAPLKQAIWTALGQVRDEQLYNIDSNVVDLGYVYDVRVRDGVATVLVTMPHRGRPEYNFLVSAGGGRVEPGIRERVLAVDGVRDVVVEFTWEPAWTVARVTDAGRRALGLPG